VQGLKAEAFNLQEKGKNQKISVFTSAAENKQAAAPKLPPGIYSNKPEYRSPGGPVVVILLDAVNTPFKDQAYARQQMLEFVRNQYKPGQKTAVLTLTGALGVLQDFTDDPDILLAALKSYKPTEQESTGTITPRPVSTASGPRNAGGGSVNSTDVATGRVLRFQQAQVAYVEERRMQMTLAGMRGLSRFLGGIPGRKSVIWVTAAFPFNLIPDNRAVTDPNVIFHFALFRVAPRRIPNRAADHVIPMCVSAEKRNVVANENVAAKRSITMHDASRSKLHAVAERNVPMR